MSNLKFSMSFLAVLVLLVGCTPGSPGTNEAPAASPAASPQNVALAPPASGEAIAGRTYDIVLKSNVDNADIAFTIHEPEFLVGGASYPLILQSHGYAGSRQSDRPAADSFIGQFLVNGFGVLSLDERGNGESGGAVRILDPAFEGQDWLQTLDWAEDNLVWLEYDPSGFDTGLGKGNPVMGSIWSSYGGGFQHLIYAIDNKQRLDAIAPDITWNDLRYSLFSGGVFKSLWGTLLGGLGNAPPNTQDQEVNEGLAQGNGTNSLDQDKLDLLYQNSLESHCRGENSFTTAGGLRQMDAFYSQSHLDTLFNFNDLYHNYDCLKQLGGDVRLMTKSTGHGLDSGDGGDQCGVITRQEATLAWYNEKLRGVAGAANYIPDICYNLGTQGDDGIVVNTVTVGGTPVAFSQANMLVGEAVITGPILVDPPLYVAGLGGDILAGIPTIDLTVTPVLPAIDPIVFIGIGVRRGGTAPVRPLMNQIRPFRGEGTFPLTELNGVLERLGEGDELVLMLLPNSNANFGTVTTAAAAGQTPSGPGTGDIGQYPTNGAAVSSLLNLSGTINLPLIGSSHPAPTEPTP